jgi:phosphoribosylformimino-5-aminoimidazole carboxamide ribotide isomerase
MIIYPAVDIQNGQCVRLKQGRAKESTVYYADPYEAAEHWVGEGARWLHVVDLDGAFSGQSRNDGAIRRIVALGVPVQVGGGIRDMKRIQTLLDMGVARVILGTAAVENPALVREAVEQYGDAIAVGIDAKNGMVATRGWREVSAIGALTLARQMKEMGVGTVIYTDIARDGMLTGPNLPAMEEMARSSGLSVIASGGVSSLSDIIALRETGVSGVIVGKALYAKRLSLREAMDETEETEC